MLTAIQIMVSKAFCHHCIDFALASIELIAEIDEDQKLFRQMKTLKMEASFESGTTERVVIEQMLTKCLEIQFHTPALKVIWDETTK